jgi:hypothetical protein
MIYLALTLAPIAVYLVEHARHRAELKRQTDMYYHAGYRKGVLRK